MKYMKRKCSPLFLRNKYEGQGMWGIPRLKRQDVNLKSLSLIAFSDTKPNDTENNRAKGVHFFKDDYKFDSVYQTPERSLNKLFQYAFLLTPDFSTYADMPMWRQIESVAHSRWCGAYWQEHGRIVVPTVSWSTPTSYLFCFDGIERHSIVAVGMIGCKRNNKEAYLRGYEAMLEALEHIAIICFGSPYKEMAGNLIVVEHPMHKGEK